MVTAILLGVVTFVAGCVDSLGTNLFQRPLITGLLTGLVMGDIKTGVIMGATLELAFIGTFSVGAALPPDLLTGGVLGTAFAISSNAGPETALLLCLPIATLALVLTNIYVGFFLPILSRKADKYAEQANTRGIEAIHLIGGLGQFLMSGFVVTISFLVGSDAIKHVLDATPDFILTGLQVATSILPALGFAMLARLLITKKMVPYFLLGFAIAAYLKVPVTGIAIFGAILAVVMVNVMNTKKVQMDTGEGGVVNYDEDEDF